MNRSLSWGTSRRMLPGAGDLAMAEFDRQQARAIDCNECGAEFDRDTEEPHERHVCPECYERMHPRCACGCGEEATIIADVVFATAYRPFINPPVGQGGKGYDAIINAG